MEYVGYIYITKNLVNNKRYIGKRQKSYFDVAYKGSGKWLKRAINKYGIENFHTEVIEWCETTDSLNERERHWISYYNAQESKEFYNISSGGDWGDISKGLTEEQYKAWGEKIRNANLGRKNSEETKIRMSQSALGRKQSETAKAKMSKAKSGENHPNFGKHRTDETKMKISESQPKKKVKAVLPNGEYLIFETTKLCYEYFENNYCLSRGTIKTLIRENKPLNSKYERLKNLNGLTVTHF